MSRQAINPAEFYTKEEFSKLMTEFSLYEIDGDKRQAVHHLVTELIDKYMTFIDDFDSDSGMSPKNIVNFISSVYLPFYDKSTPQFKKSIKTGIYLKIVMNCSEMFAYRLQEDRELSEKTLGLELFDKQGDFDDDRSAILDRLMKMQFNDIFTTVDPLLQKFISENINLFARTLFEVELN